MSPFLPPGRLRVLWLLAWLSATASARQTSVASRIERIETVDGQRVEGRLARDEAGKLAFRPADGATPIPEGRLRELSATGPVPHPPTGLPPFQVALGPWGRISGRLVAIDDQGVRLDPGEGRPSLTVEPGGVQAVVQRPGEWQALADDFEELDLARWAQGGSPALTAEPHLVGRHALRIPAGGSSITTRVPEPIASGRLELAFFDDGSRPAGQRWYLDLTFRRANAETSTVRVVPGWSEETLAVETPGGPALIVQPLTRTRGWRRLEVKFDDRRVSVAVDGDELAHGSEGMGGPLFEIRLATEIQGEVAAPAGLASIVDDLRIVRFAQPTGRFETDPTQDEVRLITGDQLFGQFKGSDADRTTLRVDGRDLRFGWAEVSGLYFRRTPRLSRPVSGLWVRVEWRSAPGDDPIDLERVEAALVGLDESKAVFDVPYLGPLDVPRDQIRRLEFLPRCRRMVIDATARHLGDRVISDLDPPQPEATPITIAFDLDAVAAGDARLALDVVQVIGEEGTPVFSDLVRKGELRTKLTLNKRPLDDLNALVKARNDTPLRVRVSIPRGLLVVGRNTLEITQTGSAEDPKMRDNLGLLGVALEFAEQGAKKP